MGVGVALAVGSLVVGTAEQRRQAKQAERADERANKERKRIQDLQEARERRKQIRAARVALAENRTSTFAAGTNQSSVASGVANNITSNLAENLSFIDQRGAAIDTITDLNQTAATARRRGSTAASLGNLGFQVGTSGLFD